MRLVRIPMMAVVIGWSAVLIAGQRTFLDSPRNIQLLRAFRQFTREIVGAFGKCDNFYVFYLLFRKLENVKTFQ